jgi:hypothetical protein
MTDQGVSGEQLLRALIAQLQASLATAQAILAAATPKEPERPELTLMGQPDDPEGDGSITVP